MGPTSFILKEEGSKEKIKVSIGDVHMCSCKCNDLCIHKVLYSTRMYAHEIVVCFDENISNTSR